MTSRVKEVKFVVGANYGDEGKGVMSNYFTRIAKQRGMSVLNVLYNGGCQRGHTAEGHVFHCFGSGAIRGADTYYTSSFMVNPIAWYFEYQALGQKPKLFINPYARVTTPYDVAINQARERQRGINRHGSCGLGIFETRHRTEEMSDDALYAKDLLDEFVLFEKLTKIKKEYFPYRCKELEVVPEINEFEFDNFISCVHQMMTCGSVKIVGDNILLEYESVIFEGGQGLLLSETNKDAYPHLTPSITGFDGAYALLHYLYEQSNANFEMCLMTRSYITRHGAGPLYLECKKEQIGENIIDSTNMPNEWQGSLRFAPCTYTWYNRIVYDKTYLFIDDKERISKTIGITCLDQTNGCIAMGNDDGEIGYVPILPLFKKTASKIYTFAGLDVLPTIYM